MNVIMQQHETWKAAHDRLVGGSPASAPKLFCPCCGHEVEGNVQTRALAIIAMSPAQRTVLNMVSAAYPEPVLGMSFVGALWTKRGKRRPFKAQRILSVHAWKINEKIRPFGWEVQPAFLDAGSRRLVKIKKPRTDEEQKSPNEAVG